MRMLKNSWTEFVMDMKYKGYNFEQIIPETDKLKNFDKFCKSLMTLWCFVRKIKNQNV